MGLLQNISVINAEPIRLLGSGSATAAIPVAACMDATRFNRSEMKINKYSGENVLDDKGGIPYGYSPPYSWSMPVSEGGFSTYSSTVGSGAVSNTTNLRSGINLLTQKTDPFTLIGQGNITSSSAFLCLMADIAHAVRFTGGGNITHASAGCPLWLGPATVSGHGTITTAQIKLIGRIISTLIGAGYISTAAMMVLSTVSCSANLVGSGRVSPASYLKLPVAILSSIHGSGSITVSALKSISVLVSVMGGRGTITQAQIKTLSRLITNILGHGTITASAFSKCFMSSDITSAGELVTAQSCAQAVWQAVAAAFNDSGTMGNKVNSASAAGDPWTAEIPGNYTTGSAGELLKRIEKIIKDNQAFILGS